jgi:hypothetical protein
MKLLGKKSKLEAATKCSEPCDCETKQSERTTYKVRVTLNKEKCWNEEIQKYILFHPIENNKILIVDNQEVEFAPVDMVWRITDRMEYFDSVTLIKVK